MDKKEISVLNSNKKFIIIIIIVILVTVMGTIMLKCNKGGSSIEVYSGNSGIDIKSDYSNSNNDDITTKQEIQEPVKIKVHVKGQVKNPGVITLEQDKRIIDAINAAGGFTKDADENSINQAAKLMDEQEIYVYAIDEERNNQIVEDNKIKGKLNINKATCEQLMELPGIGDKTAQSIIEYRSQNSGFDKIEDIMNVKNIGEGKFKKIKDLITVK